MSMIFNDLKDCSYGVSVEGAMPIWKKDDEELKAYRAIGTVSEFQKLKEKATAKKVAYQGEHEKCPSCGSFHVFDKYCSKCGQAVEFD